MSKIYFKHDLPGDGQNRGKERGRAVFVRTKQGGKAARTTADDESAKPYDDESAAAEAIADAAESERENAPPRREKVETRGDGFDKQKIIKYFKRHPKKALGVKAERFSPTLKDGLSAKQVEERFKQFLFNDTNKKFSKSYASIFIGNICSFFNLLCLCAFIALLLAGTTGFTNYLVILITSANIIIAIIQEIIAKKSIDKLSIMGSATTKVIRDGETAEIPSTEIVLDDVIILELGNQVPADCVLAEGSVEVNESLLTGESVPIKKQPGDMLYAGSFIASGSGKFRVEKVGKETYLEKLTAKAKRWSGCLTTSLPPMTNSTIGSPGT